MWTLIVSVPDHCLSFYFANNTVPIDFIIQNMHVYLRKQETQPNQMRISANFPDVSSDYYFEYHTDFQDRELKSKNVTVNRLIMDLMANMMFKTHKT